MDPYPWGVTDVPSAAKDQPRGSWLGFIHRPGRPVLSALTMGLVAAILSGGICAIVYVATGTFPTAPADLAVQLGLPIIIPLVLAPLMAFELMRSSNRLRERTAELEVEIAARRRAEERLEVLATVDDLTQVLNRREFFQRAAELTDRTGSMVVAVLDLDDFKSLNDTHGHSAGDDALRAYGAMLRTELEAERAPLIGRLGGEEFGVILPERRLDDGDGTAVFARILTATRKAREGLTTSIGVSDWTPSSESVDTALARADGALYRAKQLGRNRVATATGSDNPGGVPSDSSPITRR